VKKLSVKQLTEMGLLTAVIALLTSMVRIPVPMTQGYAHVGDAGILLAGLLMGPMGAVPAALGSALADLFAGYVTYAPFTCVVKGAMGWAAGKFLKPGITPKSICLVVGISVFMVAAYFLTDMVLFGWAAAVGSIVGNLLQAAASIALGIVLLTLKGIKHI